MQTVTYVLTQTSPIAIRGRDVDALQGFRTALFYIGLIFATEQQYSSFRSLRGLGLVFYSPCAGRAESVENISVAALLRWV